MEKAMLWLPGWGMSDDSWNAIRSQFPFCHHVTPDYSRVTHPDHFWEAVQQAVRSLDSLPFLVVGWSMGGMLAQRLASVHPVAGLVLISTTARFVHSRKERDKGWTEAHVRRMQQALVINREQAMAGFIRMMATEDERQREIALQKVVDEEWTLEALMAGLSYLREEDCRTALSSVSCPTLVIHGTADAVCPIAAGEELASLIANATLLPVADCGHAPAIFHPATLAAAIKRMVEDSVEDGRRETI